MSVRNSSSLRRNASSAALRSVTSRPTATTASTSPCSLTTRACRPIDPPRLALGQRVFLIACRIGRKKDSGQSRRFTPYSFQRGEGSADKFRSVAAEGSAVGRAHKQQSTGAVELDDQIRLALDHQSIVGLALAERLLGAFPFRDVPNDANVSAVAPPTCRIRCRRPLRPPPAYRLCGSIHNPPP